MSSSEEINERMDRGNDHVNQTDSPHQKEEESRKGIDEEESIGGAKEGIKMESPESENDQNDPNDTNELNDLKGIKMDEGMEEINESLSQINSRPESIEGTQSIQDHKLHLDRLKTYLLKITRRYGLRIGMGLTVLLAFLLSRLLFPSPLPDSCRNSLKEFAIEYRLEERDETLITGILSKWPFPKDPNDRNPLTIAIVGEEERVKTFIGKLSQLLLRDCLKREIDSMDIVMEVKETSTRGDLYGFLEDSLSHPLQSPALSALIGIERLRWDAPLSIHAWTDDGGLWRDSPPSPHSLILLGVVLDQPQEISSHRCQAFLQEYLLSKWTKAGGPYSMITPIVNARIDYSICI